MTDLQRLKKQLRKHEGFRAHPYRCTADKLTIGYGRNLDDKGLTPDEADYLMVNDIRDADADCRAIFGVQEWGVLLDNQPARAGVLIDMAFNLGFAGLSGFRKMIAAVRAGDWNRAADEMMDSKWAREDVDDGEGGRWGRAERLAKQMRTGEWQDV